VLLQFLLDCTHTCSCLCYLFYINHGTFVLHDYVCWFPWLYLQILSHRCCMYTFSWFSFKWSQSEIARDLQ
jgi:hypothetical protein